MLINEGLQETMGDRRAADDQALRVDPINTSECGSSCEAPALRERVYELEQTLGSIRHLAGDVITDRGE